MTEEKKPDYEILTNRIGALIDLVDNCTFKKDARAMEASLHIYTELHKAFAHAATQAAIERHFEKTQDGESFSDRMKRKYSSVFSS